MPTNTNNLAKGSLLLRKSRKIITFMFNPTTVDIAHGFNHGAQFVPGRSHPFYSGGEGDEETIPITLHLDGDRGRMERKQRFEGNSTVLADVPVPLDVMDEVDILRSLVLPYDATHDGAYSIPEGIFFNLGTVFRGEIGCRRVNSRITEFTPQLGALRADVDLDFFVVVPFNLTSWRFHNLAIEDNLASFPDLFGDS